MVNVELSNVFECLHGWIIPGFEIFGHNTTGFVICPIVRSTPISPKSSLTEDYVHRNANAVLLRMHKLDGIDHFATGTLYLLHRCLV